MIQIFKRNLFFNSLLLLPYATVLQLHSLIYPTAPPASGLNAIQHWSINLTTSPRQHIVLGILLAFAQAILVNRLVIKNRLGNQITLLPGMMYILMVSVLTPMHGLQLASLATTLLLIAVSRAFAIYRKPMAAALVFDVGFYISLASILYPPAIAIVIAGALSLVILRTIKWQDSVQYLTGIILPYYLWWTWLTYLGDTSDITQYVAQLPQLSLPPIGDNMGRIITLAALLLSIIPVLGYSTFMSKKSIEVQKKIDVLYWIMLCAGIGALLTPTDSTHLYLLAVPLSYFVAQYISRLGNNLTAEIAHLIIVSTILSYHFGLLPSGF